MSQKFTRYDEETREMIIPKDLLSRLNQEPMTPQYDHKPTTRRKAVEYNADYDKRVRGIERSPEQVQRDEEFINNEDNLVSNAQCANSLPTILVAEDTKMIRELYEEGLKSHYKIVSCENGQVAISELEKGVKVSVIVTDYDMPKASGRDIVEYVEKSGKDIPVIMISGRSYDDVKDLPLARYLQKPIVPSEIKQNIREILEE